MFHKPITAGQTATPDWVVCDRELDISDIWIDVMDPKNEDGAIVTADLHESKHDDGMLVKGISIVEQGQPVYWDRERITNIDDLFNALWAIEQHEMQSPGYGDDDRYDIRKEAV